jgi:hypothetical protein
MSPEPKVEQPETAETTLPGACVLCGGDVELKVTRSVARSYCKTCHWVGKPEVTVTHGGLKVAYKPLGQA